MGTDDIIQEFDSLSDWDTNFTKLEGNAPNIEVATYVGWDGANEDAIYQMGINRTTPSGAFQHLHK